MEKVKRTHTFRGRGEFQAYLTAIQAVLDGTVSPGGAAAIARTSRQRIHQLIQDGTVEAWFYYEERQARPMCEVSVLDVVRWGVRTGRLESADDMGLGIPNKVELFDKCQMELLR